MKNNRGIYSSPIKEPGELTLGDHAEAWWREQGKVVSQRETPEWKEMYEKWVNFAFSDMRGKKGNKSR